VNISLARDTLKFFNQSLSSFTTAWFDRDNSIVCLYAPVRDSTGTKVGTTKRLIKVNGDNLNGGDSMNIEQVIEQCEALREAREGVGLSDALISCIELAYSEGQKATNEEVTA
jgi:hypothetical protein